MASLASTASIRIGRSSDSARMRVVWTREDRPKPSMPRNTDTPRIPRSRSLRTMASYSGRPSWVSLSPM